MRARPTLGLLCSALLAIAAAAILLHGDPARASSETANQPKPLWDQYDNPSYGAMNSTDYRPVLDKWDSFGADDFTVPVGFDWSIDGVDVKGFCSGCDFESVNVRFYADDSYRHLPDVLVCDRPTQAFAEAPESRRRRKPAVRRRRWLLLGLRPAEAGRPERPVAMAREDGNERQRGRRLAEPRRRLRDRLRELGAKDGVQRSPR